MRREFCEVVTMSEAEAKCPWAAEIAEVEGGFLAFESMDDYTTWVKALSDNCGGDECCGCEVCTPDEVFEGSNYSIKSTEGQFVLVHPVSEDETFDTFDELVESHPICEEARKFFFSDDESLPSGVVGEHIEWTNETGHNRRDIEVAQEALDIQPTDKTTLAYLMFQELDLEASDSYQFIQCPWDSPVGYECMKVLRKARELIDLLHDLDSHQDIWSAAFEQCDVFYCG